MEIEPIPFTPKPTTSKLQPKSKHTVHSLQPPNLLLHPLTSFASLRHQDTNYLCSATEHQLQIWKLPHYSKQVEL